jgi:hypothetical protein
MEKVAKLVEHVVYHDRFCRNCPAVSTYVCVCADLLFGALCCAEEPQERCELAVNMTVSCIVASTDGLGYGCDNISLALHSLCINNTLRLPWPTATYNAFRTLMPSLAGFPLEQAVQNL